MNSASAQGSKGTQRWLVFSYFANIDGMACAHHIDDRIPYLQQKGIEPIFVTSLCAGRYRDLRQSRVGSVAPSGIRFELHHTIRRLIPHPVWRKVISNLCLLPVMPCYCLEKLLIRLDSTWSWFISAGLVGWWIARRERPDLIYSTGGPASAHLAAAFCAWATGLPWMAEFQDPLVHARGARSYSEMRLLKWAERLICKQADGVIFLTNLARQRSAVRTQLEDRGIAIYPGADPGKIVARPHTGGDWCQFAHFGSLGGSRDLSVCLLALEQFASSHPAARKKVRLVLYGNLGSAVRRQVKGFRFPEMVQEMGKIPRAESIFHMCRADILLLIQNTDTVSPESIPSKVYEYLLAGRPILGLVYRNSELRGMLEQLGHCVVEADDVAGTAQGIEAIYRQWAEGRLEGYPVASQYTVAQAVEQLVVFGQAAINRHQRDVCRPKRREQKGRGKLF